MPVVGDMYLDPSIRFTVEVTETASPKKVQQLIHNVNE
jgi:hypothetical protein